MASPVNVGYGHVKCAHGIVPVPAPATELILRGVPMYSGRVESELCTPTGAALLKYFVSEYGTMPVLKVSKAGYGTGKKRILKWPMWCARFWAKPKANAHRLLSLYAT